MYYDNVATSGAFHEDQCKHVYQPIDLLKTTLQTVYNLDQR